MSPECRLRLSRAEADRARGGEGREDGFEGGLFPEVQMRIRQKPHTHTFFISFLLNPERSSEMALQLRGDASIQLLTSPSL